MIYLYSIRYHNPLFLPLLEGLLKIVQSLLSKGASNPRATGFFVWKASTKRNYTSMATLLEQATWQMGRRISLIHNRMVKLVFYFKTRRPLAREVLFFQRGFFLFFFSFVLFFSFFF